MSLMCDGCQEYVNSNPYKYTRNNTIQMEFCSFNCMKNWFFREDWRKEQ